VAAYILLTVIASAFTRRIRQTSLSGADRFAGGGFGLLRGLVILGLANLIINAITPPDRMPAWISGAKLYPLSITSAQTLRGFAPQGAKLARQVAPVIDHAVAEGNTAAGPENRDYNDPPPKSPGVRVERSR
jgi:membrane protein required for colicin V production